ncbi:DUF3515 family protein [Jidongwangia harbinensis]|uniref:DUF3515 family protein n=1 Tax=Jidongwangia harbinensis TaxID=2878561 RepID=UPI001CD9AE7D|nr:DUF3515 family protein [Jidongwangia harbinensis]MCA2217217.1 DUF3515 domain-containing protein [Jidongwangia harbinensis]
MVDLQTRPARQPDPTVRRAALWATVVAVPVAVLAGLLIFAKVTPEPAAAPAATASAPVAVPGTPVRMAAPALAARPAEVCLAVTSQLPTRVRNLPARKVSAGPEQNAAYGEPPLTVACGVAQPQMCPTTTATAGCVPLDTELLIMNRVCWYPAQTPAGAVFTTMDREVPVQVTVPSGYANPAQWANEFSDVVVQTDRSRTTGVPSGCG